MSMNMSRSASPADRAARDAGVRAWRTLVQGLAATVIMAVVAALVAGTSSEVEWSTGWWAALGAQVGMAGLTAGVSYVARWLTPPAQQ